MGSALALRLAAAGHEVRIGSRDGERGRSTAADVGAAFGGTRRAAASNAEVVILAVPWAAVFETLEVLHDLDGTVLVDITNPFGPVDGELSGAERIQAFVPRAPVVKAWNTIYSAVVRRSPGFGGVAPTIFVAGDDARAKDAVAALVFDLGYEPVDAGPLASARYLEPLAGLMTTLDRLADGKFEHALKLLRRERPKRKAGRPRSTAAAARASAAGLRSVGACRPLVNGRGDPRLVREAVLPGADDVPQLRLGEDPLEGLDAFLGLEHEDGFAVGEEDPMAGEADLARLERRSLVDEVADDVAAPFGERHDDRDAPVALVHAMRLVRVQRRELLRHVSDIDLDGHGSSVADSRAKAIGGTADRRFGEPTRPLPAGNH
jgi:8-hydroxy-5-deazaflavin:NADPH oxidoreductase